MRETFWVGSINARKSVGRQSNIALFQQISSKSSSTRQAGSGNEATLIAEDTHALQCIHEKEISKEEQEKRAENLKEAE